MISTFNRYEKKYIMSKEKATYIKSLMKPYIAQDGNHKMNYYTISNVYYDTITDEVIKRSVSKPVFKEKLRLRCYGEITEDKIMFLELKKKFNGFVNKRRTNITYKEANELIFNKVMPEIKDYHNKQVLKEIFYYVKDKELKPRISITYDREAYFAIEDKSLRITFDTFITSRRSELQIGRNEVDRHILADDKELMEIKTGKAMPLWLTHILNDNKVFSNSFSKYGTEFYNHLNETRTYDYNAKGVTRKENEKCLNPYLISLALQ